MILLGWKVGRLILLARAARAELGAVRAVMADPTPDGFIALGADLAAARRDVRALRDEAQPFVWAAPLLAWWPDYGGELQSAAPLLDWASALVVVADDTHQGLAPLMRAAWGEGQRPTPAQALAQLTVSRAYFVHAQTALAEAEAARAQFSSAALSPRVRALVEQADAQMPRLRQGLALLPELPALLGGDAPQTYLILLQNEDELRPTGGFITALGVLTLDHAEVTTLTVDTSYAVDDVTQPYPLPPQPLIDYMASYLWLVRDSNWSPNFPTAAQQALALYGLTDPETQFNGVVAIDQRGAQMLLRAVGPVTLAESGETVDADNLIDYMRLATWAGAQEQGTTDDWWRHHKDFLHDLTQAMFQKLQDASLLDMGQAALQTLDERHLQVWLAGRDLSVLAETGWDGAIRPGAGDYWMAVDANLGFNKTNAVLGEAAEYAVDLTDLANPRGALTLTYVNPVAGELPCVQSPNLAPLGTYTATIERCYWNYLRVYVPKGANLLVATPQAVPGEWMLTGRAVDAVVRLEPGEQGTQAFGTFLVVPYATTLTTAFTYTLAPGAVAQSGQTYTYTLRIQKQAGTKAMPVSVLVQLPASAQVLEAAPLGSLAGTVWRAEIALERDVDVRLRFRLP